MRAKILGFLRVAAPWVRYGYFLRFSLMLWFFAPLLCAINIKDKTLTSGILVAEFWEQYLCIGFFLVSAGLAALFLGRVVLIHGPERWDEQCPTLLKNLLVNENGDYELLVLVLSQFPNILVFIYLLGFGRSQGVTGQTICVGIGAGLLLALFVWWLANAWYYLTFREPKFREPLNTYVLGKNAARTILFPRFCFRLNRASSEWPGNPTIEQAYTVLSGIDRKPALEIKGLEDIKFMIVQQKGYGESTKLGSSLYEAQAFAILALFVFFGLYLLIWPLTAPVPAVLFSWTAIALLALLLVWILYVFWTAKPAKVNNKQGSLRWIQLTITLASVVFIAAVILLYQYTSIERFPIFATVLILAIALCWLLGALAFLLDLYRIPVLTVLLLAVIVPRLLHLDRAFWTPQGTGQEEHYISITTSPESSDLPTPQQVLQSRMPADGLPLIIVTATGGGLHASAWTAAVLARLEKEFGHDFHGHLLLASSVSGGSIGLETYLRELHEGTLDSNQDLALARMQSAAQCSSLEGVGWGLVFYDLPKAFVPFLPYLIPPSSGDADLEVTRTKGSPIGKDRTWSLRKSFDRNLHNRYCRNVWVSDYPDAPAWDPIQDAKNAPPDGLTLRDFLPAKGSAASASYPAFTMNTTVVENGERFLLANYKIPFVELDPNGPNYRARSFLETFSTQTLQDGSKQPSDLPLASAAQLSATFPYVSSAARVPVSLDSAVNSVHFADGGYYDNDGTASAIEFLRYALGVPPTQSKSGTEPKPAQNVSQGTPPKPPAAPVRILLIEIRNSGGIGGSPAETTPDHNGGTTPWNLFNQVGAPALGFWQAGHESVTARNQSSLELLEHAYDGKLEVQAVVFADNWSDASVGTDPLNWSLTPKQRREVQQSADRPELKQGYACAKGWFYANEDAWKNPASDLAKSLVVPCKAY